MYNINFIYIKRRRAGHMSNPHPGHMSNPPPGSHVKPLARSHVKNRAQHSPGSHVKFARDDRAE